MKQAVNQDKYATSWGAQAKISFYTQGLFSSITLPTQVVTWDFLKSVCKRRYSSNWKPSHILRNITWNVDICTPIFLYDLMINVCDLTNQYNGKCDETSLMTSILVLMFVVNKFLQAILSNTVLNGTAAQVKVRWYPVFARGGHTSSDETHTHTHTQNSVCSIHKARKPDKCCPLVVDRSTSVSGRSFFKWKVKCWSFNNVWLKESV
jgi:hypothetical protein